MFVDTQTMLEDLEARHAELRTAYERLQASHDVHEARSEARLLMIRARDATIEELRTERDNYFRSASDLSAENSELRAQISAHLDFLGKL